MCFDSFLGGCFTWTSTRPEIIKVTATKVVEECGNVVQETFNPPRVTQQVPSMGESVDGCSSAATIQLPPRWGGAPSLGKVSFIN